MFLEAFTQPQAYVSTSVTTPVHLCCWDVTPAYPVFLYDQQLSAYIYDVIQHMAECVQPCLEGLILAEGS